MNLFGGVISVTGVTFLIFCILLIAAVGYAIGAITIKGINLGSAGVFVAALLFGAFFYGGLETNLTAGGNSYASDALKVIENMGLVFFVTAIGFIAGPNFFSNLKKNFKSYIVLGLVIILSSGLACVLCYYMGRGSEKDAATFVAILQGILSGALTSTPGFSAAKATTTTPDMEAAVTVGYGIAYLFGVVGVVLFVQLIPKLTKANMEEERAKISSIDVGHKRIYNGKLVDIDDFGLAPFALAAAIGIIVSVLYQVLLRSGREEQAMLTSLAGLIVVLMMIIYEISNLFETAKTVFGL